MVTWMPCWPAYSSCLVNKTKRDQYTVKKRVRIGSGCVIYATQPKPLLLRCFLFLFVLLNWTRGTGYMKKVTEAWLILPQQENITTISRHFSFTAKKSYDGMRQFWLGIRTYSCCEISDFHFAVKDFEFISQITDFNFVSVYKFVMILRCSFN